MTTGSRLPATVEHAVDHPGACHIRAIRQGAERSTTVTRGHSPGRDQDRNVRSSGCKSGDRTSKLVMRFRLPSPALAGKSLSHNPDRPGPGGARLSLTWPSTLSVKA